MKYKYITDESIAFLKELLNTSSTSGGENGIAELYTSYMSKYGKSMTDILYNSCCAINPNANLKIMLDAHYDEVGLQVTYISEEGFIYFRRNGWIDNLTLPGCEVEIIGEHQKIHGVVGKKPIHLSKNEEKSIEIEDLWIDAGFSSKSEIEKYVSVGDLITIKPNYSILNNTRIVSKGLDDKIGVFIIAEVLKYFSKKIEQLNIGIYGCATAQEEVGGRGSLIMANQIKPNIAFCLDVGFATDIPNLSENRYGRMKLGEGIVICHSCDNNPELVKLLKKTARDKSIPHQLYTPLSPTGGTNTSKIQTVGNGIRTALLAVPNRYMHTPVEMCDFRDIDAAIELLISTISTINKLSLDN